jgi:hypothetical protein
VSGCEDKEATRIKEHGYTPPIPKYNTSDMCVYAVSNSNMGLSARTLLEMCFSKEHNAKEELENMQKEGKVIGQERWEACLELATGHNGVAENGSYSVLQECAIGKIDPPPKKTVQNQATENTHKSQGLEEKNLKTKPQVQAKSSKTSRTPQVAEGKKLHLKIIAKYPSLGSEYREPFISGGFTSNPKCLISVPAKEWSNLSNQQKLQLFDYAESLIPVVKTDPEKYSGLGPNAPIASQVRQNVSRMSKSSWAIDVGDFSNGGKDLLSGNLVNSLH